MPITGDVCSVLLGTSLPNVDVMRTTFASWFIVCSYYYLIESLKILLLSVLWRCWLGDRKGIQPLKDKQQSFCFGMCGEREQRGHVADPELTGK